MISAKLTGGGLDWFMFSLIGKSAAALAPPPRLAKGTCKRATGSQNIFVWFGFVWFGFVWFDFVWFGFVWFGFVWSHLAS